jgi:hypothetical protein
MMQKGRGTALRGGPGITRRRAKSAPVRRRDPLTCSYCKTTKRASGSEGGRPGNGLVFDVRPRTAREELHASGWRHLGAKVAGFLSSVVGIVQPRKKLTRETPLVFPAGPEIGRPPSPRNITGPLHLWPCPHDRLVSTRPRAPYPKKSSPALPDGLCVARLC